MKTVAACAWLGPTKAGKADLAQRRAFKWGSAWPTHALSVRSVATSRSGALSVLTPRTKRAMLLGIAPTSGL